METIIINALHLLFDLATGKKAAVSQAEADLVHEALSPGYTTPPPSEAELASAQAILDRQQKAAEFAAAQAAEKAAAAPAVQFSADGQA